MTTTSLSFKDFSFIDRSFLCDKQLPIKFHISNLASDVQWVVAINLVALHAGIEFIEYYGIILLKEDIQNLVLF